MKIIGYDKCMKNLVSDYIRPFNGAKVLDIGCGTSIILRFIVSEIEYDGFDMNNTYIEKSRKIYSNNSKSSFTNDRVSETSIKNPESYDIAIAISILHHLNNEEAKYLFQSAHLALKPGGRLITYDPVNTEDMSFLNKMQNRYDRGGNIRTEDGYLRLVNKFNKVNSKVRKDMSAFVMECIK